MRHSEHWRACAWLLLATVVWGLSFPLIKALWLAQDKLVPNGSSLFFAPLAVVVRFGVAGVIVAIISWRSLRSITRLEAWQGVGLAFFGGIGIVLQMDGLAHTSASTSAFLTQFYCLLIPVWAAWRQRVIPRFAVIISSIMVLAGVAVLAEIDWRRLTIGRGEAETILAATFFAAQILWLERPVFAPNRVMPFTVVMFLGTAIFLFPMALITAPAPSAMVEAYASSSVWIVMGAIIIFCTLGSYVLMNRWQKYVTATEAGLIYCVEPVAAASFALFLPGMLSSIAGIDYPNEKLKAQLLIGGALITMANVLLQVETMYMARKRASEKQQASNQ
jgi:drug/metabolite transporter (DMT)-like permease